MFCAHIRTDQCHSPLLPFVEFGPTCSTSRHKGATELDNYLWIRGGYAAWRDGKPVNTELKDFFQMTSNRKRVHALLG